MKKLLSALIIAALLAITLAGCSSPEERAEKYYEKGMELLKTNPEKAKLEFQNALQMKKNMPKAMYGLALVAESKGDWKAAFGMLNKVLELQPNNVDALVKVGQIFMAGEKLDLALEKCNKALELDKNNIGAIVLRAAIQLKLGDNKGAIDYANMALEKDKKSQDAMVVLATERLQAKDTAKALEYIDRAIAMNEKNLAVQLLKISTLEGADRTVEADKAYLKIIPIFPETAYLKQSYVQFLLKHDRKGEAEKQLRDLAKADPKNIQAKLDVVKFLIYSKGAAAGQQELETYVKNEPENYDLAFALVNLYQVQKNDAKQDALLSQISKNAGDTADGFKARSFIAVRLLRAGKKDEANKLINEVLEKDKRNEQALILRASVAMDAKNYDAAIVDLRTVLRDSPDNSGAALMLANTHEKAGSPELAEEHYLRAFETSKFSPDYGLPYTQFLMRRKQPERAEKVLDDMLVRNPNNSQLLRTLAQIKISQNDLAGAQALADRIKSSGDKSTTADEIMGAISYSKKDFEGTIAAFKRAYQAAPNQSQPLVAIVRTYMAAGKSKEAIQFIQSVLKTAPNNLDAQLMLGQLYSSTNDHANAIQVFKGIVAAQPKNPAGYQQLAVAQQRANQSADAEKTVNEGLVAIPNDFGLKLTLAGIYENSKRIDEAIKTYETLIKDRPDSEMVSNNLASLLTDYRTDQASHERAHKISSTFKDSEIPQFLDTFGWASFKVGKFDDAEKALKSALEKMPETAIYHYHLAKILVAKNDVPEAKVALQKAIKYAATQPFAQKDDAVALLKSL